VGGERLRCRLTYPGVLAGGLVLSAVHGSDLDDGVVGESVAELAPSRAEPLAVSAPGCKEPGSSSIPGPLLQHTRNPGS
jgi:hypothetical protein